jgi:hypothetical protein
MAIIKLTRKTSTGDGTPPQTTGQISCNTTDGNLFLGNTAGNGTFKFIDETQVTSAISTAIGGLSSAFEYQGAVTGNGQASTDTASAATELASSPDTGDYYRISTTAGYVKANGAADTAAFFVNVGDAVVYNGTSWDTIDNTNSGITAADSGADISVTGSTDAGFVIGFASTATLDQANQVVDGGTYS